MFPGVLKHAQLACTSTSQLFSYFLPCNHVDKEASDLVGQRQFSTSYMLPPPPPSSLGHDRLLSLSFGFQVIGVSTLSSCSAIRVFCFLLLWCADLSYVGCFQEPPDVISDHIDKNKRPWSLLADSDTNMTIQLCKQLARDQGLPYAALQYGSQCYGGSDLRRYTNRDCSTPCAGNGKLDSTTTCGGGWTNAIYLLAGEAMCR